MRVRLEPSDEYLHPLTDEATFNESMYFNVYDPTADLGAFFRLGNRANEGRGEMTVCLYLPGGRVGFMFQRPEVRTNDAFDAAGLRFTVVEPFEELTVTYDGNVVLLDDPTALDDPRAAFTEHPHVPCTASLTYRRVSDMFGGEPEEAHERPGEEFAKGHYEQLVGARGTITVGDETFEIDGYGLRDHSWGPRTWQAPWYYRWLTGNFGDDAGFMVSRIARRDSDGTRGGFVWDEGRLHLCNHAEVETEWDGERGEPRVVRALLRSGEREWRIEGAVGTVVPLRNRRDGMVTRIAEGLTTWSPVAGWSLGADRRGAGWSEYLDQVLDGAPVGIAE